MPLDATGVHPSLGGPLGVEARHTVETVACEDLEEEHPNQEQEEHPSTTLQRLEVWPKLGHHFWPLKEQTLHPSSHQEVDP